MSALMALDIGLKRTGLAIARTSEKIAFGLCTVATDTLLAYLKDYPESIDTFVIGLPKKNDNTLFEIEHFIHQLINQITEAFPHTTIARVDERFTSAIAQKSLWQSGLSKKKRQNKALIDEVSATLILQTYIQQNTKVC